MRTRFIVVTLEWRFETFGPYPGELGRLLGALMGQVSPLLIEPNIGSKELTVSHP